MGDQRTNNANVGNPEDEDIHISSSKEETNDGGRSKGKSDGTKEDTPSGIRGETVQEDKEDPNDTPEDRPNATAKDNLQEASTVVKNEDNDKNHGTKGGEWDRRNEQGNDCTNKAPQDPPAEGKTEEQGEANVSDNSDKGKHAPNDGKHEKDGEIEVKEADSQSDNNKTNDVARKDSESGNNKDTTPSSMREELVEDDEEGPNNTAEDLPNYIAKDNLEEDPIVDSSYSNDKNDGTRLDGKIEQGNDGTNKAPQDPSAEGKTKEQGETNINNNNNNKGEHAPNNGKSQMKDGEIGVREDAQSDNISSNKTEGDPSKDRKEDHERPTKQKEDPPRPEERKAEGDNTVKNSDHDSSTTEVNKRRVKYDSTEHSSNKKEDDVKQTSALDGLSKNQTIKYKGEESGLVCSPWEVDIDEFWQDHPDWEPSLENATHACFSPMTDQVKASFLRQVHQLQFPPNPDKGGCDKVAVSWFGDYGFGSHYMIVLANDFLAYYYENRPFTITNPNPAYRWAYTPWYNQNNTQDNSWAACPTNDGFCYFLPISSCQAKAGTPRAPSFRKRPKKKLRVMWDGKSPESPMLKQQHEWFSEYMMRPRQETRRRLYELIQSEGPQLTTAPHCAWIHVRRGDAMTELSAGFYRNFYPIQQYLTKGRIHPNDGDVLILTDDEAAIEEALLLHPEYQWKFFNKTRNRGVQRMHSHFPTKDAALETLTILAEMKVASQCRKGVFGESKYPKLIEMAMASRHHPKDMRKIKVDIGTRRIVEDANKFMEELEAKLEQAKNATTTTVQPKAK